ncbi:MAG: RluA family pseudouridine synthase [Candidatus Levybacteria bacterium]|nr:RluA family pseudouridine synthase [Candidatus Levybacteria bacterium]
MNIVILYEDEDLLVVNKPAGMTVNRATTTKNEITVQDWAEKHIGIQTDGVVENKKFGEEGWDPELDFYSRGGIVHRLDKETSGVLILAKNPQAFVKLQKQFHDRTVKKAYVAFAHGSIAPDEGEISVPVGRLPWDKNKFGILPGGKESKTLYKVLKVYLNTKTKEKLTLVEMYPQSGRTHQIRVHLKYINHPIFADFLYAGRKTSRDDRKVLPRVFLHAAKITFNQPTTEKLLTFEASLPDELSACLEQFTLQ